MKKLPSLTLTAKNLALAAKRFPISVMLITGLAILLFADIRQLKENFPLYIFFSFGAVIGLAIVLWLEDFAGYAKQQIVVFFITLLWGVYCFFLPEKIPISKTAELCAISLAVSLSVFFISFLKKGKNKAFWNFSERIAYQMSMAIWFGTIIYIGLSVANYAITTLFDLRIISDTYINLAIICFVLFSPIYFLANIPDKTAKHGEEISLSKSSKIMAYILVPLAAIYAVILYIYLIKIIFTWELPQGLVSYLVSALAFIGFLIITLLYPIRMEGNNKFVNFLSRYFGLIILPLLTLMTIGILRRISDYGITIHRGYVLLLNIWFYGIYIFLFIRKAESIKWIPISFAAIALFFSIGFWSIPNVTKHILIAEITSLSNENLYGNDKKKFRDKVEYLHDRYGKESVPQSISDIIPDKDIGYSSESRNSGESFYYYAGHSWDNEVLNTGGFNAFVNISYSYFYKGNNGEINCSSEGKQLIIKVIPDNRTFSIPLQEEMLNNSDSRGVKNVFKYDDYKILLESISGNYYKTKDSVHLERFRGYLFYNK
jgi:hypothetical protein